MSVFTVIDALLPYAVLRTALSSVSSHIVVHQLRRTVGIMTYFASALALLIAFWEISECNNEYLAQATADQHVRELKHLCCGVIAGGTKRTLRNEEADGRSKGL